MPQFSSARARFAPIPASAGALPWMMPCVVLMCPALPSLDAERARASTGSSQTKFRQACVCAKRFHPAEHGSRLRGWLPASGTCGQALFLAHAAIEAGKKRNGEDRHQHESEQLGHARRRRRKTAEAECGRHDSNDEKYQSPVKHARSPEIPTPPAIAGSTNPV